MYESRRDVPAGNQTPRPIRRSINRERRRVANWSKTDSLKRTPEMKRYYAIKRRIQRNKEND